MSLRTKLISSFVGLTLLMSLSGLIGLFYIGSINKTLNHITDVAAPTVEASDDLIAAIWRTNAIVDAILVSEDSTQIESLQKALQAPMEVFATAYAELRQLVKDELLLDNLDKVNNEWQQFVDHSQQAIEQQLLMLAKEADSRQLLVMFEAVGTTLTSMLNEFAMENQAEMQKAREDGDLLTASEDASAEQVNKLLGKLFEQDYPVVEASLKLQRLITQLQAVCRKYLAQDDLSGLKPIPREFERLFAQAEGYISVLKDLTETREESQDARDFKALVDQWSDTVLGDDGLFDSHRDMLVAELRVDKLAAMFSSFAGAAAKNLDTVADGADQISDDADKLAGAAVATTQFAVSFTVAAGVILALVLGISITRAITRPIAELVETVGDVRASGDLTQRSRIRSSDEVGVMAKALNDFLSSLEAQAAVATNVARGILDTPITLRSQRDTLGSALTEMTATLRESTKDAAFTEWVRNGQGRINDATRGALEESELGARLICTLAEHMDAQCGTFFVYRENANCLQFLSGYAVGNQAIKCPDFALGEGLVGQVAQSRKPLCVDQVPPGYCTIGSSIGEIAPRSLVLFPLVRNDRLLGVFELAFLAASNDHYLSFLSSVQENICIAMRVAQGQAELRRLLDQTKQQAIFFRVFKDATDPIVLEDLSSNVIDLNHAAEQAYGWTKEELIGKPIKLIVPEDRRDYSDELREICLAGGEVRNAQCVRVSRSGEPYDVLITLSLLKNEKDESIAVASIAKDITSLRRAQESLQSLNQDLEAKVHELAAAREAAEAANQAKSAFLAKMSHELRTPMNAILGYSEMLMEEAEDAEQEAYIPDLKKINQAGNHLLALINDVLDLAKIESGKMEAFAEMFDVGALIDQVSGTAQPLMAKNNNHFTITRGEALGSAYQDVTKLRQSLFNLVSNAAKFTHQGTITLSIERESIEGTDWLSFAVNDTGIGIAEEKLHSVFEEFSQADNSTTRDYGGTGLGLSISRRFCQMLGGDLSVTSQLGVGSTFTIRLPALLPSAEVAREVMPQPVPCEVQEARDVQPAAPGSTVLVIDDDAEACEIIRRFLEKDGFHVVTALRGEEGLRLAHQWQPVAITLDVMMPDMDGWSVLRALKSDPKLQNVPVVMLSMVDDKSKAYALGAADYLTKPVEREQLRRALAHYHTAGEPCSVLLVEDDEATREIMARTLEKYAWRVREAGNGREALAQLAQETPRLILLDLMMPVMDGFDFLLEMRAHPQWRDIPVIVLTAKDLTEEDRRVLSGRVEQIVAKGACPHEHLLTLIHQLVVNGADSEVA